MENSLDNDFEEIEYENVEYLDEVEHDEKANDENVELNGDNGVEFDQSDENNRDEIDYNTGEYVVHVIEDTTESDLIDQNQGSENLEGDDSDDEQPKPAKRRKSYSLYEKIRILDNWEKSKKSQRAFAAENGLADSTFRRWMKQKTHIIAQLRTKKGNRKFKVRVRRRLVGGGRKPLFPDLEVEVANWITERNDLGLRVKDKYVIAHMKNLCENRLAILNQKDPDETDCNEERDNLKKFVASPMWLHRFKERNDLVSRRETSCRTTPEDYQQAAKEFILKVNSMINEKKIHPKRVINLDQVPRYIELNNGSTITKRGTQNVQLKKSSTSHKRFTWTPAISLEGKIVLPHVLFSNLKKKPTVNKKVACDVNTSGMFSREIIENYIDLLLKRTQSPFHEPTLIIMDAYGSHVKFVAETKEQFEKRRVFFVIIPAKLTGLLQPLDVCLNRSFQKSFEDQYIKYLDKAMKSQDNRTKAGNIKMPTYEELSDWCYKWCLETESEMIKKAFTVCGIGNFDQKLLHEPLKLCFKDDELTKEEMEILMKTIPEKHDDDEFYSTVDWIAVDSLFGALFVVGGGRTYATWKNEFKKSMFELTMANPLLKSVVTEDEVKAALESEIISESRFELVIAARMLNTVIEFQSPEYVDCYDPSVKSDETPTLYLKIVDDVLYYTL